MEAQQLRKLLDGDESATIELKSEPYWIDHKDDKVKNRQRDELIKDILALANGNSIVAGDRAYLIIGANDKKDNNGVRTIYDVGDHVLTTRRILDIVNSACTPKLEDLEVDVIELDGKRLIVITINPNPHLFETTRRLEPSTTKGAYSEYVVFIRHNESVRIASGKERDAIAKLKRIRFNEVRNPPPEPFGALIGATVGALSLGTVAEKVLEKKEGAQLVGTITGSIFGGSLGFMIGGIFKDIVQIRTDWYKMTPRQKPIVMYASAMIGLSTLTVIRSLLRKGQSRKGILK